MSDEAESAKTVRYEVGRPQSAATETESRSEAAKATARGERGDRIAVLAIHGMGQQIPYETIDAVRAGLARQGEAATTRAESVRLDCGEVERLEYDLERGDGSTREVHLYEAYWAPLTEGKVTLRDTIAFLARAGWNGLLNASRPLHFSRFLSGRLVTFPIPLRTLFQLVLALLGILSLVVTNGVVAALLTSRLFGGGWWTEHSFGDLWTNHELFADVTGILDLLVTALLAFALTIAVPYLGKKWLQRRAVTWTVPGWLGGVTNVFFFLALYSVTFALVAAPVAIVAVLFYAHRAVSGLPAHHLLDQCNALEDGTHWLLLKRPTWMGLAVLLLVLAASWLATRLPRRPSPWLSAAGLPNLLVGIPATLLTGWIAVSLVTLVRYLATGQPFVCSWSALGSWQYESEASWRPYVSWALLVALSFVARRFFVEYVGDVAAYVTPHSLDRFWKLRAAIKANVMETAAAVYDAKDEDGAALYDGVIVVGHSLGSLVGYDTLNALIERDLLNGVAAGAGVRDRTRLFLTFGSPLDKLAFLFARQSDRTTEAREALAAARQPLAQSDGRPFPWVNVYSPKDILGGRVDFFDDPEATLGRKVENVADPEILVPIAAHSEFWTNHKVFAVLQEALKG